MQNKRFLGIAAVVVFLVILATGCAMLWSLTAAGFRVAPLVRASNVEGDVQVAAAGSNAWRAVDEGYEIHSGDRIKTAEDASVDIRWGDRGVTRVDGNTDVVLDTVPEPNQVTESVIRFKVVAGRAWSRMLKLLDVNSRVEARTDSIVATVRGTAFGVGQVDGASQIAVTESVVQVVPNLEQVTLSIAPRVVMPTTGVSDEPASFEQLQAAYENVLNRQGAEPPPDVLAVAELIPEGKWGSYDAHGTRQMVCNLADTYPWPTENAQQDRAFDDTLRESIRDDFAARFAVRTGGLVALSERMRTLFTSQEHRSTLMVALIGRRIAAAVQNPDQALSVLGQIDADWWGVLDTEGRERVLGDVRSALFLNGARPGFVPPVDLVQALQSMRHRLLGVTVVGERYADALDIDDAIDAYMWPPSPRTAEDQQVMRVMLVAAIAEWRNVVETDGALTAAERLALRGKADSLLVRLFNVGETPSCHPEVEADEVIEPSRVFFVRPRKKVVVPTPVAPASTVPTSTVPVVECPAYDSLSLKAIPATSLLVGDTAVLELSAICSDGISKVLTADAVFAPAVIGQGTVSGNVFTPAVTGTIMLTGTVNDHGVSKQAQTTVIVMDPVPPPLSLLRIDVGVTGPTALTTGQNVPLTARAVYSDGTVTDIVYQCVWSTSNPQLGTVITQRLYALTGSGSVDAICTFTDPSLGVTKSGSLPFTVTLDPSLTPSGGGSGGGRTAPSTSGG